MTTLTREMIDAFPVANLHVHLGGVIPAQVALELGLHNNLITIRDGKISPLMQLPVPPEVSYKTYADIFAEDYEIAADGKVSNLSYNIPANNFNSFDQVMGIVQGHKYGVGGIQNPTNLTYVLDKYLENCLAANVKYVELKINTRLAEIIFSQLDKAHAKNEFFDLLKPTQQKFADAGIALKFQQCFNKSSGANSAEEAEGRAIVAVNDLLLANSRHTGLFVGIDSAGNEKHPFAHPKNQRAAYSRARANGFKLDCHAGEGGHAQAVVDAVENLGVSIIGHGIQIVESRRAMHYAVDRELLFLVCPSMNMFLGVSLHMPDGNVKVQNLWQHPFWQMLREPVGGGQLKVALATDNPDLGGVPYKEMLLQLTGLLPEVVGKPPQGFSPLTAEELLRCARNSLAAIPDAIERNLYEAQLSKWARFAGIASASGADSLLQNGSMLR